MTEKERQESIELHRQFILNSAEEIAEALKDEDVDDIYYSAQFIMSEYAWLQSLERAEVDEADS